MQIHQQGPVGNGSWPRVGSNGDFCNYWYHSATAQLAKNQVIVKQGQTAAVGPYAFTLARYRDAVDTGSCDASSEVQFIAIRN